MAVLLMVQAGMGVALLCSFAPMKGMDGITCIPLEQTDDVMMNLIWRKEKYKGPLKGFIDFVRG